MEYLKHVPPNPGEAVVLLFHGGAKVSGLKRRTTTSEGFELPEATSTLRLLN